MTRYLLDTNHAGSLLRPQPTLPGKMVAATEASFALCLPSIGELWYMVYKSTRVVENQQRLESLLGRFDIFAFDQSAAREFGRLLTELRRGGRPIPAIDAQIAAIALAHGLTLLTADAHFDQIPALGHENWL
jgi:tRNA(fMet)-specific endonuclease VapC